LDKQGEVSTQVVTISVLEKPAISGSVSQSIRLISSSKAGKQAAVSTVNKPPRSLTNKPANKQQ